MTSVFIVGYYVPWFPHPKTEKKLGGGGSSSSNDDSIRGSSDSGNGTRTYTIL